MAKVGVRLGIWLALCDLGKMSKCDFSEGERFRLKFSIVCSTDSKLIENNMPSCRPFNYLSLADAVCLSIR